MKKAIDRTKAALHRQTPTEDIDSDKTEGDEVEILSKVVYGVGPDRGKGTPIGSARWF